MSGFQIGSRDDAAVMEALVDEALVAALIPWACPGEFGVDGRYRLDEVVGIGSSSVVYAAADLRPAASEFGERVAIKVPRGLARCRQPARAEADLLRRVLHPNVVRVIEVGRLGDGTEFLVEELLEGLDDGDEAPPLPARRAVALAAGIARGVQAAHDAGVVHGDLKPSNILLTPDGRPKVSDFGFAGCADDEGAGRARGNLGFMAPEQFHGGAGCMARPADIYAIGGLLYYFLTGEPVNGGTADMATNRLRGPAHVHLPTVGVEIESIIRRATHPAPMARHRSAAALAEALERCLAQEAV